GLLLLTLAVTGGAALAADAAFDLANLVREVLLGVWIGIGAVVAVFGLILPVCRRIDPEALAALIEEKYPELGERLTTTVEVAGDPGVSHGSPALIALLAQDTEARTAGLDVFRAFPARAAARLTTVGLVFVALLLSPALFWPTEYKGLAERFLA